MGNSDSKIEAIRERRMGNCNTFDSEFRAHARERPKKMSSLKRSRSREDSYDSRDYCPKSRRNGRRSPDEGVVAHAPRLKTQLKDFPKDPSVPVYHCKICDIHLIHEKNFQLHCLGKKHMQKTEEKEIAAKLRYRKKSKPTEPKCKRRRDPEDEVDEILPIHGIPHVWEIRKYDCPPVFRCFMCNTKNLERSKDLMYHVLSERHKMACLKANSEKTIITEPSPKKKASSYIYKDRSHRKKLKTSRGKKYKKNSPNGEASSETESSIMQHSSASSSDKKHPAYNTPNSLTSESRKCNSKISPQQSRFFQNTIQQVEFYNRKLKKLPPSTLTENNYLTSKSEDSLQNVEQNFVQEVNHTDSSIKFSEFLNWILSKLPYVDVSKDDVQLLDKVVYKLQTLSVDLKSETPANKLQRAFREFISENGLEDVKSVTDLETFVNLYPSQASPEYSSNINIEYAVNDGIPLEADESPPIKEEKFTSDQSERRDFWGDVLGISQLAEQKPIPGLTLVNNTDKDMLKH